MIRKPFVGRQLAIDVEIPVVEQHVVDRRATGSALDLGQGIAAVRHRRDLGGIDRAHQLQPARLRRAGPGSGWCSGTGPAPARRPRARTCRGSPHRSPRHRHAAEQAQCPQVGGHQDRPDRHLRGPGAASRPATRSADSSHTPTAASPVVAGLRRWPGSLGTSVPGASASWACQNSADSVAAMQVQLLGYEVPVGQFRRRCRQRAPGRSVPGSAAAVRWSGWPRSSRPGSRGGS